jgi:hypothetical protein
MREKEKDTQGLYTKMKMKMKHTNAQLARKKTYLTAKLFKRTLSISSEEKR